MRGQDVGAQHLVQFLRAKRQLFKSTARRDPKTGEGAPVQDTTHCLLDGRNIVRRLQALGEIGNAKDAPETFLQADPGNFHRHGHQTTPREHLRLSLSEIMQSLLHVPNQAAQKERTIFALDAHFAIMDHDVLVRLTHSTSRW